MRQSFVEKSFSALVIVLSLAGCSSQKTPKASQTVTTGYEVRRTTTTTTVAQPGPAPVAQAPQEQSIVVEQSIREACGLSPDQLAGPAETGAHFPFASAQIKDPKSKDLLESVAKCINDGKLGDSKLELIGFTDPRGSDEYNMKLGQERADAVKNTLTKDGVNADRFVTESRGKSEATGTDEASWALDRRVEIHRMPGGLK
jgi:peptidoglycan-associated lipoprotein